LIKRHLNTFCMTCITFTYIFIVGWIFVASSIARIYFYDAFYSFKYCLYTPETSSPNCGFCILHFVNKEILKILIYIDFSLNSILLSILLKSQRNSFKFLLFSLLFLNLNSDDNHFYGVYLILNLIIILIHIQVLIKSFIILLFKPLFHIQMPFF